MKRTPKGHLAKPASRLLGLSPGRHIASVDKVDRAAAIGRGVAGKEGEQKLIDAYVAADAF